MALAPPTQKKLWRDALRRALTEYENHDVGVNIRQGEALGAIAKKLVSLAVAGEQWAILELGNRVDGKPATVIEGGDEDAPVRVLGRIRLIPPDAE